MDNTLNIIRDELNMIKDHNVNDFDFALPVSSFNGSNREKMDLNNLSKSPNFNECQKLSIDENGNSKKLTSIQLDRVRKEGKIGVQSEDFLDQEHVWKVGYMIQKGTDNIKESFYDDLSVGCHQIIVSIPNRIYKGKYVTLKNGIKNLFESVLELPVLLVGWISKHQKHGEYIIEPKMEEFTEMKFVESVLLNQSIPETCFTIESVNGSSINLIIDKKKQIMDTLSKPYNEFKLDWEQTKLERRKYIYDQITSNENDIVWVDNDKIIQAVINEENKEYQVSIFKIIEMHLNKDDALSLINLIKSLDIFRTHMKNYDNQKKKDISDHTTYLKENHYIMSRSTEWMNTKITEWTDEWLHTHPIENVYKAISQQLTGQEKYLFDIKRSIETSDEYKNEKENLEEIEVPDRIFVFNFRIWQPSNWKITKNDKYFIAEKYNNVEVSTEYPGWRIINVVVRTANYFWNSNFYLLVNFWQGKFGLRSLYGINDFYTGVELNEHDGTLKPTMSNLTWFGRIKSLWENITEARREFEEKPDTGLFGKSFTRIIDIIWNYGVKGILGTPLCFIGHPLLVAVNTLVSGALMVTSPAWAPIVASLRYLFDIIVYDFDSPDKESFNIFPLFRTMLYKFLVLGVGQTVGSLLGVLGHGIAGLVAYIWAFISNGIRYIYDAGLYHIFIKNLAKVPSENDMFVTRVSGPGLSNKYFYLISHNLALVMLQYQLEKMEMEAFSIQTKHRIEKPLENLLDFYSQFGDVGMTTDPSKQPAKNFTITRAELNGKLRDITNEYWKNYNIQNEIQNRQSIKMSNNDLNVAIEKGVEMAKTFVTNSILSRLNQKEQIQFWTSKNIVLGDWVGLVKYCYCGIFNNEITIPIENVDSNGFHLVAQETNVGEFIKDLFNGNPKDGIDFDAVNPVIIDQLLKSSNNVIFPEDALNSHETNMMTINKTMINKFEKQFNHEKKNQNQNQKLNDYGTISQNVDTIETKIYLENESDSKISTKQLSEGFDI